MAAAKKPKYDQDFFLALAAKGKEAWNAWRCDPANEWEYVTFAGIDFSESPWDEINFSGFEFGDSADFSGCKWRGVKEIPENPVIFNPGRAFFFFAAFGMFANFTGAAFGNGANFMGATFGHVATFNHAAFGDFTTFRGTVFGKGADFKGAAFGIWADFDGAAFVDGARFNGAAFGNEAGFSHTAFGDGARFNCVAFGDGAAFIDAAFGDGADFSCAAFGDEANFNRVAFAFGDGARFNYVAFGDGAIFVDAAFGDGANFSCATFGNAARFDHAAFGDRSIFSGAAFGEAASFADTIFKGHVECSGKSIEQWSWDLGLNADEADEKGKVDQIALKNRHDTSWKDYRSGPDRFLTISFENASFVGEADFSGRSFERAANFISTHFYSPPNFDAATNVARIDFTGAHIGFAPPGKLHWSSETKVPIRLRALRKIAEETKNHDLERDLYIEERKAERGVYLSQLFKERKNAPKREWPLIAGRLLAHVL
jgi:hypothetical protein